MAQLSAQGPIGASGPTSQVWTTPYPHGLGERARDKAGNEYMFVQCLTAVAGSGLLVSITSDGLVAPLLNTSLLVCRVGVAQTTMAVGDGGWVQIYGTAFVQGNNSFNNAASTELTSIGAGVSTSEADANGLQPVPQFAVTSPTGTLSLVPLGGADEEVRSSLVSLSSNVQPFGNINIINGMYLLTATAVSNLPNAFIIAQYPTVTSPVSAVSNTTGPVTLTTLATSHIGGEWVVFLNYPYLSGIRTS